MKTFIITILLGTTLLTACSTIFPHDCKQECKQKCEQKKECCKK